MTPLFITGTDTDVGKTYVTARLAKSADELCYKPITQKWIQSGLLSNNLTDIDAHNTVLQMSPLPERLPYVFELPASPHLSAEQESIRIKDSKLVSATQTLQSQGYWVLIEGSGGVFVPHRRDAFMIDLLTQFKFPTLLVSANRLGVLNHTFLTIEALQHRNIPISGVLLNDGAPNCELTSSLIKEDNYKTLRTTLDVPVYRLYPGNELPKEIVPSLFNFCKEIS